MITCGKVDEKKDYVLKVWVARDSRTYDHVFEMRNIHKSNITHLICLSQKISGLFPNNLYKKDVLVINLFLGRFICNLLVCLI